MFLLTKVVQLLLPWKGYLGTPCPLSNFEWPWNADSKCKVVLKNLDLFKQVVFRVCVFFQVKRSFKEMTLLFAFFPRLELIFAIIPFRATNFLNSFLQIIQAALDLYGLEVLVFHKLKGQTSEKEAP